MLDSFKLRCINYNSSFLYLPLYAKLKNQKDLIFTTAVSEPSVKDSEISKKFNFMKASQ